MDTNPIRYSDLVAPDSAITDLIAQLQELIGVYENAKSKIQSSAAAMEKSIEGVSGATAEQQEQLKLVTTQTDRVYEEYKKLDSELLRAKTAQAQLNEANREASMIGKLIVQNNNAKEGSYNKLSAQYRLNKITLNAMSQEERYATEAGRQLEKETAAIYARMNEMQKATGKYTLQVGNYERALGRVVGVNSNLISVLTDSKKATEALHGALGVIKSPVGALIGAIGAVVSAFKTFRASIQSTQQTGDAYNREMAGWSEVWERFKVSVSTVDFSGFIRDAASAAAAGRRLRDVLDEVFERTNSIALQRAQLGEENEVLLETLRDTGKEYQERIDAGEKYLTNVSKIYEQETEMLKDTRDAELDLLWARVQSRAEAAGISKEQFAADIQNYNLNLKQIRAAQVYNKRIKELDMSIYGLGESVRYAESPSEQAKYQKQYERTVKTKEDFIAKTTDETKRMAAFLEVYGITNDEIVKGYVDAQLAYVNSLSALPRETRRITTQLNSLRAQQAKDAENARKKSADEAKRAREQQAKDEEKAAQEAQKRAENEAKEAERRKQEEIKSQRESLKLTLTNIQTQISIEQEGTEQWLALRMEMIRQQREIELFENRQKATELKQDESLIYQKYDAMMLREAANFRTKLAREALDAEQKLAQARIGQVDLNERQLTEFRMQQERQRLIRLLEIDKKAAVKMTDTEREAIKETIKALEKEAQELPYNNIYELLGLSINDKQQSALDTALEQTKKLVSGLADSWVQAADAAVKSADDQVAAAQKALDAEIEARNAGYANNVATAQKELILAQRNREKALKEQEKAQKAQAAIDTLEQSSSLITATANIWKAWAARPVLAGVITATMWSSFLAAKIKAAQVTKYEHGGVELLEGGSHASGHDIDLGVTKSGRRRKAEGGEYLAIINRKSSRRYGQAIPAIVNALNDGTFEQQYLRAGNEMQSAAVKVMTQTDVSRIEKEVTRIRQQGDESRSVEGGYIVSRYKNLTRKIKS